MINYLSITIFILITISGSEILLSITTKIPVPANFDQFIYAYIVFKIKGDSNPNDKYV